MPASTAAKAPQLASTSVAAVDPAVTYPFAAAPEPGRALEVGEGVLWLRTPLPFALDHINLWLLRDGDGWTAVDCGYTSEATIRLWDEVIDASLGGRPITRVIATHYHPDHVGLAHWLLARFDAEFCMTQSEYLTAHAVREGAAGYGREQLLELFRRHGLDRPRLDALSARSSAYNRGVPELPRFYRRLSNGECLTIGGMHWEVVVGYGHSPEHAALLCRQSGTLISGDMVLPRISTNVSVWGPEPDGDPLGLYLESVRRYARLAGDPLVLPSHGMPFRGLERRVADLVRHHEVRLEALAEACSEPRTAAEVIPVLFRRSLDVHQVFFAMGEAMAHMNWMLHRNLAERQSDDEGIYRFRYTGSSPVEIVA